MIIYKVFVENKFVGSSLDFCKIEKLVSKLNSAFQSPKIEIRDKYIEVH